MPKSGETKKGHTEGEPESHLNDANQGTQPNQQQVSAAQGAAPTATDPREEMKEMKEMMRTLMTMFQGDQRASKALMVERAGKRTSDVKHQARHTVNAVEEEDDDESDQDVFRFYDTEAPVLHNTRAVAALSQRNEAMPQGNKNNREPDSRMGHGRVNTVRRESNFFEEDEGTTADNGVEGGDDHNEGDATTRYLQNCLSEEELSGSEQPHVFLNPDKLKGDRELWGKAKTALYAFLKDHASHAPKAWPGYVRYMFDAYRLRVLTDPFKMPGGQRLERLKQDLKSTKITVSAPLSYHNLSLYWKIVVATRFFAAVEDSTCDDIVDNTALEETGRTLKVVHNAEARIAFTNEVIRKADAERNRRSAQKPRFMQKNGGFRNNNNNNNNNNKPKPEKPGGGNQNTSGQK